MPLPQMPKRKNYRFLTGPDNAAFCQRVSDALDEGYVLYGAPVMSWNGTEMLVGQAIVLPEIRDEALGFEES